MKIVGKILGIILITLVLIIGMVFGAITFFETQITQKALAQISKEIDAPISIENVSLNLFRRVPYTTIELNNISFQHEANLSDTSLTDLFKLKRAFVSIKTLPIFKGKFEAIVVEVEGADIFYAIDSLGNSSIDFLMDSLANNADTLNVDTLALQNDSVAPLPFVDLERFYLKDIHVYFKDDTSRAKAHISIPELSAKGSIVNEVFSGTLKGSIEANQLAYADFPVDKMKHAKVSFDVAYDKDTVSIHTVSLESDGVQFGANGKVHLGDAIYADIQFKSEEVDFNELLKYAPVDLLDTFSIEQVKGLLTLNGHVKGIVNDSTKLPQLKINLDFKDGYFFSSQYPEIKNLAFNIDFNNGAQCCNESSSVSCNTFSVQTPQSLLNLKFNLYNLDKPSYQLTAKAEAQLDEFAKFVPDSLLKEIGGRVSANLITSGVVPDSVTNSFIEKTANNVQFELKLQDIHVANDTLAINNLNGKLEYANKNIKLDSLSISIPSLMAELEHATFYAQLEGPVTNMERLTVNVDSFNLETPQLEFNCKTKVSNLTAPQYVFNGEAHLYLDELKPFISDTLVKRLEGVVNAQLYSYGEVALDSTITEKGTEIAFKQTKLNVDFSDINIDLPDDTLMTIRNLGGVFKFNSDSIFIDAVAGKVLGIPFAIDSTTLKNVYQTAILNQADTLKAFTNIHIGDIFFDRLAALMPSDSSAVDSAGVETLAEADTDTTEAFVKNFFIDAKGRFALDKVVYEDIEIDSISTKFLFTDSLMIVDQFKLKVFQGATNSSVRVRFLPNDEKVINVRNSVHDLNIQTLLYKLDKFIPDSIITHENLTGKFSTDNFYSRFVFIGDSLSTYDMRVKGDLMLEDGGIYNYEPAMMMKKFTNMNNLDKIEFKTIKSNVFMFKNKLYVPGTAIVSNAMDLSFLGMQSFEDENQYHIEVFPGDFLWGKSKKRNKKQEKSSEEASEEDLARRSYKLIYGYVSGDKKMGFDNASDRRKMQNKIRTQETMLNLVFYPKITSFDTGVK